MVKSQIRVDMFQRLGHPLSATDAWTDKSPHKVGFITVNGVRLHYLDWGGSGDTLLLLLGMGGCRAT